MVRFLKYVRKLVSFFEKKVKLIQLQPQTCEIFNLCCLLNFDCNLQMRSQNIKQAYYSSNLSLANLKYPVLGVLVFLPRSWIIFDIFEFLDKILDLFFNSCQDLGFFFRFLAKILAIDFAKKSKKNEELGKKSKIMPVNMRGKKSQMFLGLKIRLSIFLKLSETEIHSLTDSVSSILQNFQNAFVDLGQYSHQKRNGTCKLGDTFLSSTSYAMAGKIF